MVGRITADATTSSGPFPFTTITGPVQSALCHGSRYQERYCLWWHAGSLQHLLLNKADGPLFAEGQPQLRAMLDLLLGCACGMECLHSQDIVHGNLRARNVLLAGAKAKRKPEPQIVAPAPDHAVQDGWGDLQLVPLLTDWGISR